MRCHDHILNLHVDFQAWVSLQSYVSRLSLGKCFDIGTKCTKTMAGKDNAFALHPDFILRFWARCDSSLTAFDVLA